MSTPSESSTWKARIEALGTLGLIVHLSGFALCMVVFFSLISMGLQDRVPWVRDQAALGSGATLAVAYALTQALKPARILLTLALTPVLARWRASRS